METRLKSLREDHDLYQKDIAKVLNMSQRGYSHYESGKNIPNELQILENLILKIKIKE